MPSEPERNIEKTLKAYARRRRQQAGAPLELHPATRRMLQGEVVRLGPGKARRPSFWSGVAGLLKRRMVFVCVLVALAGVSAVFFIPALSRAKRQEMASLSQASKGKLADKETATLSAAKQLAKVEPSTALRDRKESDAAAAAPAASASALNEPGTPSVAEQQKDERSKALALNAIAGESGLRQGQDQAKTLASAQSTIAPAAGIPAQASSNGRGWADIASPALALPSAAPSLETPGGVGGRVLKPADRASGLVDQSARARAQNSQATDLAYKKSQEALGTQSDAAPVRSLAAAAPPPPSAVGLQPPPVPAAPGEVVSAFAMSDSNTLTGSATQRFFQLLVTNSVIMTTKSSENKAPLGSFRVEQNGGKMRVIDADGSIYSGFVQTSEEAVRRATGFGAAPAPAADNRQPAREPALDVPVDTLEARSAAAQSYYFRVTGTNRSLRQPVVFSGILTPGASSVTGTQTMSRASAVGGIAPIKPAGATVLPLSRAQLRGRVLIGTNMMDVNATPGAQ